MMQNSHYSHGKRHDQIGHSCEQVSHRDSANCQDRVRPIQPYHRNHIHPRQLDFDDEEIEPKGSGSDDESNQRDVKIKLSGVENGLTPNE